MPTVSHADAAQARGASHARKPAATAAQPAEEKSPETKQGEQKPSRKRRALASVGSWTAAVAAAGVGGVLTVVILELSSSHAAPARPASAADPPITALIDLSGSGPCGSPQTVVASPGPIGRSASGDYPGLPASGGWLNVLVQGDGGEPVTIESITAKVISRQPEERGTVLYSYCQGYSPSHTYIRLDLRQSQPAAVNVPEPNPTGPATVVPLPIEVTGDSPAQFYIEPVSGSATVRWTLQIHWERGSKSGTLTALVSNGQQGAVSAHDVSITTVGTDGDPVLCPDGTGDTWAPGKGGRVLRARNPFSVVVLVTAVLTFLGLNVGCSDSTDASGQALAPSFAWKPIATQAIGTALRQSQVIGLAADDRAFVLAALGPAGNPLIDGTRVYAVSELFTSGDDGASWRRVSVPGLTSLAQDPVAGYAGHLYLLGEASTPAGTKLAMWTSVDGLHWSKPQAVPEQHRRDPPRPGRRAPRLESRPAAEARKSSRKT